MEERGNDPIVNLLYHTRDGAFDLDGKVAGEVACRNCGYNLFKLPATGRCPECGAPVGVSATGDLIQNSRPEWVEHVARWTQRCAWCNFAIVFTPLLLLFRDTRLPGTVALAFAAMAWAIVAWQSVRPERAQPKLTRAQMAARCAGAMTGMLVFLLSAFAAARFGAVELLTTMIILAWAAYLVGSAAQMRALSALMYRAPNTELAWRIGARAYYLLFWHISAALAIGAEMNGTGTCCFGLVACIGAFSVTVGMGLLQSRAAAMLSLEARVGRDNLRYHEQMSKPPAGQ